MLFYNLFHSNCFFTTINSVLATVLSLKQINNIDLKNLIDILKNTDFKMENNPSQMISYIIENYSWNKVSHLLFEYFQEVIKDQKTN